MTKMLTVVMPAYNEEKIIYNNILETMRQVSGFTDSFDIIVVNDGSTDETKDEIIRAIHDDTASLRSLTDDPQRRIHLISYKKNRGKGYAVRRGLMAAGSEMAAFVDSDMDLPPRQLEGFIAEMKESGADIVIGSKMHRDSNIEYPFGRRIMSLGYYLLVKNLFRLSVKDTQTGIKLFRTAKIKPVLKKCRINRFSFDIEMLAFAAGSGMTIREMPIELSFRRSSERRSKISIRQILIMAADIFRIKLEMQ